MLAALLVCSFSMNYCTRLKSVMLSETTSTLAGIHILRIHTKDGMSVYFV